MQFVPAPELTESVTDLFRDTFDREPLAVGRAPGRVNLIGEHTDYNEGLCLPIALPHATYAAVARRPDDRLRLVSRQADGVWEGPAEEAEGWTRYVAGLVRALRAERVDVPGLDVAIDSALPVGAGLSSSAALECAVGIALAGLVGPLDEQLLVRTAMRAEREHVGAPTGGLDQTVAMYAEPGHALLIDFMTLRRAQVPWHPEGHFLLVVDTGIRHDHASGAYAIRREECAEAAYRLHVSSLREARLDQLPHDVRRRRTWVARARHVITENRRVELLAAAARFGDWSGVGGLMTESHRSLRDDFEVSCPELDLVVQTAREYGARGARMTGGGFGGCAIALVKDSHVRGVGEAIDQAFEERGWPGPAYLLAEPSGAATVQRLG